MKKIFSLLICFFALIMVGCTNKNNYKIELDSNSSTGYSWVYSMSEEGIVELVEEKYIDSNSSVNKNFVGTPGVQSFEFKGLKEGHVTLTFVYTRAWEEKEEPEETKIYNLVVDKNLKVSLEK